MIEIDCNKYMIGIDWCGILRAPRGQAEVPELWLRVARASLEAALEAPHGRSTRPGNGAFFC